MRRARHEWENEANEEDETFSVAYEETRENAEEHLDGEALMAASGTPMHEFDDDGYLVAESVYLYPDPSVRRARKVRSQVLEHISSTEEMRAMGDATLLTIWQFNPQSVVLWFDNGQALMGGTDSMFGIRLDLEILQTIDWGDEVDVYDMESRSFDVELQDPTVHVYIPKGGAPAASEPEQNSDSSMVSSGS